ncbi:PHP domain-containing protein [Ammoniphilus sp. CFH 90114]|uniref:PHP domain-containing protein n=1 Tax=Ammoniphilus sp. CFH 90114 TaxID=2493665 RepID=UPI00100F2366|nr:PHP domain-containing protein [Ammoniphilus sp. CFH 90114]RXT14963.1 PHP domain-containing protein [Ammoniphilus sp. CFH 90114]
MVDLHSHTTASDGTYEPHQSIRRAKEKGLRALAITDHDTVAGIKEALEASERYGVEVVPGIEISTVDQGQDIHVLGYYINYQDPLFLSRLESLRNVRDKRNEMIIENLQHLGIDITLEEVSSRRKMDEGNIGRPHIAEVLMGKGIVSSMEEAFREYLGKTGKAYANPPRITPEDAVDWIKEAGGVPVLAHPGLYGDDNLVHRLIGYGIEGIEAYHTDHSPEQESRYSLWAKQHGLIETAGSDFHGERNGVIFHGDLGTRRTSYETVEKLKSKAEKRAEG